jgi:hypothetical protein
MSQLTPSALSNRPEQYKLEDLLDDLLDQQTEKFSSLTTLVKASSKPALLG